MAIETALLIDRGDTVTPLVDLLEAVWPEWYNPRGASARADLAERMAREHMPLGIVAFVDGALAGTCALAAKSGGLVTERGPWLGGLVVAPEFRGQGVGAALLARTLVEARRLGHERVYALTATAQALFVREGWRLVETTPVHGEVHAVFVQSC
ncbi:MAG: GNAT family N-acetyltransferase [Devosia sp.]|jgi:N-acetylglutamate synthase-like GNAT family acetyltransferase|uniref:GNAT family N-acetyltransferase n=1 Tax=unclassified Devosia TaxID=196773 RepID=UPI0019E88A9A|nr:MULTISPECIES: GNAT family N-acetyltransferase [unclassified Devosia]MBF0680963.1 GNAT family N-acetyltransferase [Devosia sp.]WEJ32625.1 GNAT family N-acetyltransferase [Devosia sp. SD17-2]